MNQETIEKVSTDLIAAIGEDIHREGLKKTPQRVAAKTGFYVG